MYIEDHTRRAWGFRFDGGVASILLILLFASSHTPALATPNPIPLPSTEPNAPTAIADPNSAGIDPNANPAAEAANTPVAADTNAFTASFEQITANKQTVTAWKERVAAPQTARPSDSREALRQLIEMVRSVRIDLGDHPDEDAGERYGQACRQRTDPNTVPPIPADANQALHSPRWQTTGPRAIASASAVGDGITEATAAEVRKQLDASRPVADALTLAEVLLRSGRKPEAAALYGKLLAVMDPNDRRTADDRAWTLLQRGKCLHETDAAAAMESYRALLREFPQSPWVAIAKTQMELIGWLVQDKPLDLLEQCRTEIAQARQLSKVEGIVQNEQ